MAGLADVADLCCNLKPGFGRGLLAKVGHGHGAKFRELFKVEGFVAAAAERVAGAELNQRAMFAADYFARVKAHYSGRHLLCAEGQSLLSGVHFCTTICATVGGVNHNCQVETWGPAQVFPIIP